MAALFEKGGWFRGTVDKVLDTKVVVSFDDGTVETCLQPASGGDLVVLEAPTAARSVGKGSKTKERDASGKDRASEATSGGAKEKRSGGEKGGKSRRGAGEEPSRYRGVRLAGHGKWQARISIQGTVVDLGTFPTEKEAAMRFDEEADRKSVV